jgi:hypothetical protein
MRAVIAHQWYRIDKADGSLLAVNAAAVVRAALGSFTTADVIKTGRFQTPYAIYSRGDLLTDEER